MCKLLTILDIENEKLAEQFVKVSIPIITKNDDDGLGIMRLGENGVSGNRWVTIPQSLKGGNDYQSPYASALEYDSNTFGTPSKHYKALAVHARQATNDVCIKNTHPFVIGNSALMHNGVVTSDKLDGNKISTCDSELLLWRYIDGDILASPDNLTEALNDIDGYYACIVFNSTGVVDIWRDNAATLYLAHVKGLGTVICTTAEIIKKVCRVLRLKILSLNPILPFSFIRWELDKTPAVRTFTKPLSSSYQFSKYQKEFEEYDKQNALPENHWWEKEKEKEAKLKHVAALKSSLGTV